MTSLSTDSLALKWKEQTLKLNDEYSPKISISKINRQSVLDDKKDNNTIQCLKCLRKWTNNPVKIGLLIFFIFYVLTWLLTYHIFPSHNIHNINDSTDYNIKNIKINNINNINSSNNNNIITNTKLSNKLRPIFDPLIYNKNKYNTLNVAVSVLITKDPGIQGGFLDSAAALVMSIIEANSKYNVTLIALVHKNVTKCIPLLRAFGYIIRSYDTPFKTSQVKNKQIGKEMETDGCCGILETLKLWVWTWNEFDVVLQIDADVHFHKNFDELFELNTTLGWTHGATAHINQELMNGGYLIVKPNKKHFNDMLEVLLEGDFTGRGWKKSGIGWVYGGRTIQGIVPYYYLKVAVNDETEFDRCKYNNMVEIEKCRKWIYKNVTSNHFTWCQKPWYCIYQGVKLCDDFRNKWWKRSWKIETQYLGFEKGREECPKRRYWPTQYKDSPFIKQFLEENNLKLEK